MTIKSALKVCQPKDYVTLTSQTRANTLVVTCSLEFLLLLTIGCWAGICREQLVIRRLFLPVLQVQITHIKIFGQHHLDERHVNLAHMLLEACAISYKNLYRIGFEVSFQDSLGGPPRFGFQVQIPRVTLNSNFWNLLFGISLNTSY